MHVPRSTPSPSTVPPTGTGPGPRSWTGHRAVRGAVVAAAAAGLTIAALAVPPAMAGDSHDHDGNHDHGAALERLARQTIPAGDGWGSAGAGTTGGSAASAVVTVRTWPELKAAVTGNDPKIVVVDGRIDANTDAAGAPLGCEAFAQEGYSLEQYLATYDPAVWGTDTVPSGPVEDARRASQRAHAAHVTARVGSNTTLIGAPGAQVAGAALQLVGVQNVIVRGLTLVDAHDCFPAWDPTDGAAGAWNSEYDLVTVRESTNLWIDHNDLGDGDNLDSAQPLYFGRPYQVHDGLLDITNGSDLVTVSYNRLHDHDKSMLVGSSDSRITDRGKLRITMHHNEFRNLGQRVPRVRFGQVDVYNNHYVQDAGSGIGYGYSWGVGKESHLLAEANAFSVPEGFALDRVVGRYNGTAMTETGNAVNGVVTDLLGQYNATHDPDVVQVPSWEGVLRRTVHPVAAVPRVVGQLAGPQGLGARERIVVAADGSGDATTAQGAVDLAPSGTVERVEIRFEPGTYAGRVVVDRARTDLSFVGATGDPADVVITDDRAAGTPRPEGGTWGTTGSASVTVAGAGFEARAVTFENAFDEAAHPEIRNRQAVAVKTTADRVVFHRVRFLGNQDTLYLDSPSATTPARVYVRDSWIEGDVDFVFGRATAVIEGCTIKALRRASDPSGYVFAPSTSRGFAHGFLVTGSRFVSNAGPGSYYLGRPWHPSSAPDNDPRVVVRSSWIGDFLKADPWTTMSGYDWSAGSNAEYRNWGPGAVVNADRPQLTRSQAADHEVADYLAGDDGWSPQH
ncbi:pectinesterase family protein [Antribacter gilvus]|uniref:pectinesterase family protein n=1 Tax=Antribacter gilvus TaxID=2304675 RepID=UPI0013DF0CEC|nr:pectinesterase family protein [Antribacter gilvus]